MKIESLDHICTMGTGRWYAVMDENDEEKARYFVSDNEVCDILDERHSDDPSYEGPWMPSLNDEYEQIYTDLSAQYAEELAA